MTPRGRRGTAGHGAPGRSARHVGPEGGGGLGATGRGLPGQTVAEEFADVPQLVQLLPGEVVKQAGPRAVRVPGGGFLQCVLSGPGELGEVDAAVCRAVRR